MTDDTRRAQHWLQSTSVPRSYWSELDEHIASLLKETQRAAYRRGLKAAWGLITDLHGHELFQTEWDKAIDRGEHDEPSTE